MKYLNVQELASHINVKVKTIYSWISLKEIPYFKLGRLVRFEKDEIDRWLEQKKVDPINLDKRAKVLYYEINEKPDTKSSPQKKGVESGVI